LECPKRSLPVVERNLIPTFSLNFAKCFHTSKQQLIPLSQTAQSKDCTTASRTCFADATPGSPCRCGRPPGLHPGSPAATKRVSFSEPLVSSPSLLALHEMVPEPFSYLTRRFLLARDRRRHHRCHRRGTCPVNGHRHRGWTSDLFSSWLRPELRGSPVDTSLHPWQWSGQLGVFQ
jgi:hypothetical protein